MSWEETCSDRFEDDSAMLLLAGRGAIDAYISSKGKVLF